MTGTNNLERKAHFPMLTMVIYLRRGPKLLMMSFQEFVNGQLRQDDYEQDNQGVDDNVIYWKLKQRESRTSGFSFLEIYILFLFFCN